LHEHTFADTYNGPVGYGLDRDTDEATVKYYLQKFSDDRLMARIIPRMSPEELDGVFTLLADLLRRHLTDKEYHVLFLGIEDGKETV